MSKDNWSSHAQRTSVGQALRRVVLDAMPSPTRERLRAWRQGRDYRPPVRYARLGDLRRLRPISRDWGFDRGNAIDRYYIEQFLTTYADCVHGRVLEVSDDAYTRRFGGSRVTQSDVLHVTSCPKMTIQANLTCAGQFPADAFDCFICTQTLHFIYDMPAAIRTIHHLLKPGGVVLATFAGISKISPEDMAQWGDHWRLTTCSARRLFECVFPAGGVQVHAYGNVLTAAAFLYGLAAEELSREELDHRDPLFQMLVAVCARKGDAPAPAVAGAEADTMTTGVG